MSMTLANLKLAVYSRLAAEEATPDYSAVHEDNLTRWINESIVEVISMIDDPVHYEKLIVPDHSLTFSSGIASLPSDFLKEVSLLAGTKHVRFVNNDEFERWDSSNFALTPTTNFPVATVMGEKCYVKPTSYSSGRLVYIKTPTDLSSAADETSFSALGDRVLIDSVTKKALQFLEVMD